MKYDLSRTEAQIMEALWNIERKVTPKEILDIFNKGGKNWTRQTLNTLLTRLENKGLIMKERNSIEVLYSEQEYRQLKGQNIIDSMYEGKLSIFLSALTGRAKITIEEEEELSQLINKLKESADKSQE